VDPLLDLSGFQVSRQVLLSLAHRTIMVLPPVTTGPFRLSLDSIRLARHFRVLIVNPGGTANAGTVGVAAIPEPSAVLLLSLVLGVFGISRRKPNKKDNQLHPSWITPADISVAIDS